MSLLHFLNKPEISQKFTIFKLLRYVITIKAETKAEL